MSPATSTHPFDLVFMFGPPLFDKLSYLPKSLLRPNYIHLTLCKLFEDNPSFGLRDVSLLIISELKQDKQVIIEDEFYAANTRKSILSTVKKKVTSCRALLAKIIPDHGLLQVLWSHQNAHGRGFLPACSCQNQNARTKRWFDSSLLTVDYKSGFVDAPSVTEGFLIQEIPAPFQLQSKFKCEVPSLLIQWEAAFSDTDDFNTALANICCRWTTLNEHGRIILISDGKKDFKPVRKKDSCIHQYLKELSIKTDQPVFVVRTVMSSHSNSFCVPPQPGLMAFIQTRHFIDLQAKHTLYIFETNDHMKMAQASGVKYVKSSKVFRYPEKTLSSLCVIPPVPSLLRDMSVVKSEVESSDTASLPLVDHCEVTDGGFASQTCPNGLEELVFIPDVTKVLKIQESFANLMTPIDVPGSKMVSKEALIFGSGPCASKDMEKPGKYKRDASIQKLPVWMTRRLNRKSTESSISSIEGDEQESSFKFAKTVYLMSEKELKEMAIQVMKQAGKSVQKTTQETMDGNYHPG